MRLEVSSLSSPPGFVVAAMAACKSRSPPSLSGSSSLPRFEPTDAFAPVDGEELGGGHAAVGIRPPAEDEEEAEVPLPEEDDDDEEEEVDDVAFDLKTPQFQS